MPFDGILTKYMAGELNEKLGGGRIGKIYHLNKDSILLLVRAGGENHKLLVTSNPASPRIHLTEKSYDTPENPTMFCMLLRKHLTGGLIRSFSTQGFERIMTMEAECTDELGDRSLKKLVIEIMGRHSNILLLNKDDKIHDVIKHVDQEVNRVRELLPARTYILPPAQNKLNAALVETQEVLRNEAPSCGRKTESFLLDRLQGFSPVLCREVCHRAGIDEGKPASELTPEETDLLITALSGLMQELDTAKSRPCVVFSGPDKAKAADFHCLDLLQYADKTPYASVSQTLDAFYAAKSNREFHSQRVNDLIRVVGRHLEKCEKRLAINLQTYEENKTFENVRKQGELITANIHALSKGMESARVFDYYSEAGEYADIPLNKLKSPQENAQIYFKKYNKARNAFAYAEKELETLKTEAAYLENVLFALETAEGTEQLLEIRQELLEQGYLKAPPVKGKPKKTPPVKALPEKYVSADGFDIFVGKNNLQNDRLTLKTSRQEDIWFHVKNYSGSHVVIRAEGKDVPDTTLLEAAGYAAWFSKARTSSKVEVDYTAIRHVKKPSGAKPGMVIYVNYNTLVVPPKAPAQKEE